MLEKFYSIHSHEANDVPFMLRSLGLFTVAFYIVALAFIKEKEIEKRPLEQE